MCSCSVSLLSENSHGAKYPPKQTTHNVFPKASARPSLPPALWPAKIRQKGRSLRPCIKCVQIVTRMKLYRVKCDFPFTL